LFHFSLHTGLLRVIPHIPRWSCTIKGSHESLQTKALHRVWVLGVPIAEAAMMHELSVAESILNIAVTEAQKHDAPAIERIKLRLGEFTGVVRDALEFAFEIARHGTLAESAVLEIEIVPLRTKCPNCGCLDRPEGDFCLLCDRCGQPVDILTGREMEVEFVDLAEAPGLTKRST
jgi:hydrogenase nickel incorporation protein HypA/HybF